MASYEARINLIVEGEGKIKALEDRVSQLSKSISNLKNLDVKGVFEDPLTSGAVSKLKKVRAEEVKATEGVIKGQRVLNNSTEHRLMQQIKLNAAVDLYARRVSELGRTSAGDQKQFQARIEDIQKGFEFFKGKGSVQGVQAVATELGRIVEYSREVNRLEVGRIKSQEQLRGYSAQIGKYAALGLDTTRAQATFDKLSVNAGTNKYALAEKYNVVLGRRLRLLRDEATLQERQAKQDQKAADQQKKASSKGFLGQLSDPSSKLGSAVIGGGFPALMGGGPGTILGGALGGALGGFAGSIAASAIGQVFDDFGAAAIEVSKSLAYPIEGFEKLKEAGLLASKQQEYYISKLIETGRVSEATAIIQGEIIKKIGVTGVNDLTALENSTYKLSKEWATFNLNLQAALAGPLAGLTAWLAGVVGEGNKINAGKAFVQDVKGGLSGKTLEEFNKRSLAIERKKVEGGGMEAVKAARKQQVALAKEFESRSKPQIAQAILTPEDREKAIKASEQQADIIKDAYRTGFRLQQQGIDLQRQGSDLQRRVAQDVYNKQQEILRLQVDNDRQRKQVAIEMIDLEYKRRISNEEGRVAAVLEAESALMKTKAEGEANIEAKKRLLELDIDKQKRETENYIFELGRTIDNIRRATLSYEMDVVDYRLKIERQIGEQRRIEDAGQAAGAPTGGNMGKAIEYFTGDPKLGAAGGYRADHGGSNYHDHIAYKTAKEAKEAAALLNRSGIKTTELKGVNPVGGHAARSYHYSGQAFDVPGAQVPVGQEPALSARVRKILQIGAGKATAPAGSMETQLTTAQNPIKRPSVPTPGIADVQAGMESYNEKNAALRKQALSIEQQLQNLREQAALDNLAAVARGPKEIQQRKDALAFAKAELGTIGAGNQELQERLAFEAQSGVKIKIYQDANNDILAKTKLQGEERKKLELALATGLTYTKQQIDLDREALQLAQQTRFEKEQAAIQAQLGVTGKGLQAGFIGQAGQAYESEMLKSGNVQNAELLAAQTQALELATTKARALEGAYNDIGSAMASTLTDGVAGLVAGTTTAEQVFVDFLKNIGDALIKAAQQMIAQYLAIAAAKALAGLFGGGGIGGGGGSSQGFQMPEIASGFGLGPQRMFADGGRPPVGVPSLVGEKGPELFVPSTAGTIIPNHNLGIAAASGGGGNTSVVVNVDATGSKVEGDMQGGKQLGTLLAAAVQKELIKQKRPGGILA